MQPDPGGDNAVLHGEWRVLYRPAHRAGSLSAWIVVPRRPLACRPPIIAVHGLKRGAREQAVLLAPQAAAHGHMVIAPHFDEVLWKRYQQLVINGRADQALLALYAELRAEYKMLSPEFILAGFSGGAQFAHRFAMLHPDLVHRLVIAAAGWYTFPDDAPFPYGLGDQEAAGAAWGATFSERLGRFLQLPMKVLVGALDNVPDATLRRGVQIDRVQGTDRLTRGRRWANDMRGVARGRGLDPQITFHVLDDCPHDFATCVRIGGLDRHIVASALQEAGG
ncbi:MAG: alpha/beta hydrolase [Devosia sp.]